MTKIKIAAALIAATVSGCATAESEPPAPTEAAYKVLLETWVGKDEAALIRALGAPTSTYDTASTRFVTYVRSGTHVVPGYGPTTGTRRIGNTLVTKSNPGQASAAFDWRCATTFEIEKATVVGWSYEGNNCRVAPQ